jgi:tryptophanyl-tRNA synthetase
MARILTGIQSTGVPHIGNLLGAILPTIELSKNKNNEMFSFIADMHSLTSIKDGPVIRENTYSVAATWLAFGVDVDKNKFYRQSDVPEVTELAWYLNCFMPYNRLQLAHSFKDKSKKLNDVNSGLFNYPVLMAADILLYDADIVPVGKDQMQHLEFTRDLVDRINNKFGDVLKKPEISLNKKAMYVPGVDGKKMSKSYGNTINIFETDKKLKKTIMGIKTDNLGLEEPKNPDSCTVFKIYSLLASNEKTKELGNYYRGGNYGYGHAKKELFELICEKYGEERELYNKLMSNKDQINEKLEIGSKKAKKVAKNTIERIRNVMGY